MLEKYAKKITDEYNRWVAQYHREVAGGHLDIVAESFAAFMCNAITTAVKAQPHREVKEYFRANADSTD